MIRALAVLFCIISLASASVHNLIVASAHKTTHEIISEPFVGGGSQCSATAIGPHALLTASHCEEPVESLSVDGKTAKILSLSRDGFDHTIYWLDITFTDYAKFSAEESQVGDDIFIFGNPGSNSDLFRKGYVSNIPGIKAPAKDLFTAIFGGSSRPSPIVYDLNGWMGDSGAAIFNSTGEIVGVVSVAMIDNSDKEGWPAFKVQCGFPIKFSEDVLKRALQK